MIRVSLDFSSVEQAIVALGKLGDVGQKKDSPKTSPTGQIAQAITVSDMSAVDSMPADKKTPKRKGRADKGVKRGSYKDTGPAAPSPAGVETSVVTAADPVPTPVAPATPSPVAPNAAVAPDAAGPTAQAVLEKLFDTKGMEVARAVMARFGVKRLRELDPSKHAEFIVDANKAMGVA